MYVKRFGVNTEGRDIAVGDIHAHFSWLYAELARIGFNEEVDRLFIAGDLVDRGPENLEAINLLYKSWAASVMGNHDHRLANYMNPPKKWLQGSGAWFNKLSDEEQKAFALPFQQLPFAIEVETQHGVVGIVHATCAYDSWATMVAELNNDNRRKTHKLVLNTCMYTRTKFEARDDTVIKDIRAVVVGHNPVDEMLQLGNTYYIDTEGWKPDKGKFTLLDLDTLQVL